jgi:hypothetical protein
VRFCSLSSILVFQLVPSINLQLVQKIFLAQLAISLTGVNPDGARQILGDEDHLTPVFPALCVSLIGGASTERDGETDDETQDGKQEGADCQWVYELRDTGDERRPESDNSQGKDHLGKDGAVHAHEERPFRVFGHVTRANLCKLVREPTSAE